MRKYSSSSSGNAPVRRGPSRRRVGRRAPVTEGRPARAPLRGGGDPVGRADEGGSASSRKDLQFVSVADLESAEGTRLPEVIAPCVEAARHDRTLEGTNPAGKAEFRAVVQSRGVFLDPARQAVIAGRSRPPMRRCSRWSVVRTERSPVSGRSAIHPLPSTTTSSPAARELARGTSGSARGGSDAAVREDQEPSLLPARSMARPCHRFRRKPPSPPINPAVTSATGRYPRSTRKIPPPPATAAINKGALRAASVTADQPRRPPRFWRETPDMAPIEFFLLHSNARGYNSGPFGFLRRDLDRNFGSVSF